MPEQYKNPNPKDYSRRALRRLDFLAASTGTQLENAQQAVRSLLGVVADLKQLTANSAPPSSAPTSSPKPSGTT